jgi:hypothetical protein
MCALPDVNGHAEKMYAAFSGSPSVGVANERASRHACCQRSSIAAGL